MAEQYDQFAGLELLPSRLLEEIVRTDFNGEENYSDEMMQYVLKVLVERGKEECPESSPNVQEAWKKLQLRMDTEEWPSVSVHSPKQKRGGRKGIFRRVAVAAACVAVLFVTLITVQAVGVDIFGALGTWTDSTFQFEAQTDDLKDSATMEEAVEEVFSAMGIPTQLFPTWIPEGYVLLSVNRSELETVKCIQVAYTRANGGKALTIAVEEYFDPNVWEGTIHEKDSGVPFLYTKNGREFYVFENSGTWTAAWCDTVYGITICGADSKETVIAMIDSIAEFTKEQNPVIDALSKIGLPTSMAPTWIPEEYALFELDPYTSEFVRYVFTAYCASGKEDPITVEISEYYDTNVLDAMVFFKSPGTPEIYVSNGRQFYIFRNADTWTATWSDGTYCITIAGVETAEIAKSIIDSIPVLVVEKNLVAEALSKAGLPTAFAPTWIPEGYSLCSIEKDKNHAWNYINAVYAKPECYYSLTISIEEYFDKDTPFEALYEKSPGEPEIYVSNGRQFYIFRNADTWTATWLDGTYCITIAGVETAEIAKSIIDSIPVLVMEKNLVAEALSEAGLPTAFAPTWIPQGYELIEVTPIGSVLNKGVAATYTYKGREFNLHIDICEYYDSAFLHDTVYEKNAGAPEEYQSNGRRFNLFRNADTWTAVWSDGRYSIAIGGIASREDAISIIDSIQKSDSE